MFARYLGPRRRPTLRAALTTKSAPPEKAGDVFNLALDFKTMFGDLKGPQPLVVVAITHLVDGHRPTHLRMVLDVTQQNHVVVEKREAADYICGRAETAGLAGGQHGYACGA